MANYNYATLNIPVTADTRPLIREIARAATTAGDQLSGEMGKATAKGLGRFAPAAKAIGRGVATGLGVATAAAAGFGVAAFRTAARVGEMDASLRALAKANRQSYPEMQRQVQAIRRQGIEAGVAQQVVAQFSRNQLRLADSSKLARVAQDAAVISGRNSTEVLSDIIHGITTQNSLVLRNAGVNVQAGQAIDQYAKSLGKSSRELTNAERSQAVLNAVLAEGKNVAGAYAAAMEEPGKVLRSFPRIFDDIKLSVGQGLVQAFGPVILQSYKLAKALSEAIAPGGKLQPIFDAIGKAAGRVAEPLIRLIGLWARWLEGLKPAQIDRAAAAIKRWGPALAVAGAAAAVFTGGSLVRNIPIVGGLFGDLVGPITSAGGAIGKALLPSVGKLIPALAPVTGAITGGGGLTAALSAITGPVGLAVAAIGLMIAASPKLRGALLDIGKAFVSALKPVFAGLWAALKPLVAVVWELAKTLGDALAPAFKALAPILGPIGQVLGVLLGVVGKLLTIFVKLLVPVIRLYGAFLNLYVTRGVVPVFNAIAAALRFVASWAERLVRWIFGGSPGLIPAFQALQRVAGPVAAFLAGTVAAGIRAVATAVGWVVGRITSGWGTAWSITVSRWGAMATAITGALGRIRAVTGAAIAWIGGTIARGWAAVWSSTSSRWTAIGGTIAGAWTRIRGATGSALSWIGSRISNTWAQILSRTRDMWNRTVGAVGAAWGRVVAIVRAPVKTLVQTVINNLIRGINALVTKIGIKAIPIIQLGFASGGKVPGAGRGDHIPALLEPGETVVTRADSRRPEFRRWARARGIPGYYQGGLVTGEAAGDLMRGGPLDFVGSTWRKVVGAGKSIVSEFGKLFRKGVAAAFELMAKPLKAVVSGSWWAKSPELFREFFGKQTVKIIDAAIEFIRGKEEEDLGLGGVGVAALAAEVIKKFPGLQVTSAMRPGDPGYHGKGWARDLGGPVGTMNAAGRWMTQTMTSALLEGIHNPSLSVKNYKRVPPGFWGHEWGAHADHIHMAAPPGGEGGSFGGGPAGLRKIADALLRRFGIGWALNLFMGRLKQESGFNQRAVNRWDINWQQGTPSVGYAQVIGPTFQAYAGPYRTKGPFMYGVSIDPWANLYAAIAYSLARYGRAGLQRAWAGTAGYAEGGTLYEPVAGLGLRTGRPYTFGENAPAVPESWTPLDGRHGQARGTTINVYPQAGQSEEAIAAAVSRRLAWAQATGRAT